MKNGGSIHPNWMFDQPKCRSKSHGLDIIFRHVQKNNASLFNVLHGKFMEIHPEDPSLRCLRDI